MVRSLPIRTSPSYTVQVGEGLLDRCGELLQETLPPCRVAVISDSNVAPLYLASVMESLRRAGFSSGGGQAAPT